MATIDPAVPQYHRARIAQYVLKRMRQKSPESTLTAKNLLAIVEKPPLPLTVEITFPRITFCCGCMCGSYGIDCPCRGEGCRLGMRVHIDMEKNHWKRDLTPPQYAPSPPMTLTEGQIIKVVPHNFKAHLNAILEPFLRAAICAYNEKYAKWAYGHILNPDSRELDYRFRTLEDQLEATTTQIFNRILDDVGGLEVLDRNSTDFREKIMMGSITAFTRRA
ncbi:hypothetical protein FOWG_17109 [Fusarium oxysporum f. sp. lycopersici MN25]|nr:hypothetical protein FOWG_18121 [Fusarium oxysporum f. sp. lycopersici MN25]EWZ78692.1 hypothetical protein FOWG_17109 [Fusarium oxysporum f. sp. lycopersici MN25]